MLARVGTSHQQLILVLRQSCRRWHLDAQAAVRGRPLPRLEALDLGVDEELADAEACSLCLLVLTCPPPSEQLAERLRLLRDASWEREQLKLWRRLLNIAGDAIA